MKTDDELLDELIKEQPEYQYVKDDPEYRRAIRRTMVFAGYCLHYHVNELLKPMRAFVDRLLSRVSRVKR